MRLAACMLGFVLVGCPSHEPCTPASLAALKALYRKAAEHVIDSGACDAYNEVQECPEYRVIELHYMTAGGALCGGGK